MTTKYADVVVYMTVSFEDDGKSDERDQAHGAAACELLSGVCANMVDDISVIGEVRDTRDRIVAPPPPPPPPQEEDTMRIR